MNNTPNVIQHLTEIRINEFIKSKERLMKLLKNFQQINLKEYDDLSLLVYS